MYIHLDLPKVAKWFRYKVSIPHPLGFNWHPDWECVTCSLRSRTKSFKVCLTEWLYECIYIYIHLYICNFFSNIHLKCWVSLKNSPNQEEMRLVIDAYGITASDHTMSRWLSKTSSSRFKQSATDVPAKARNEEAIGEAFLAAKNNILPSLPCFSSSCCFFNSHQK